MKPSTTLADIRAKLERGEFAGVKPGTSFEEVMRNGAYTLKLMIAVGLGFPLTRIVRCEFLDVDDAIPGKVGLLINFEPSLSDAEREEFGRFLKWFTFATGTSPAIEVKGQG